MKSQTPEGSDDTTASSLQKEGGLFGYRGDVLLEGNSFPSGAIYETLFL